MINAYCKTFTVKPFKTTVFFWGNKAAGELTYGSQLRALNAGAGSGSIRLIAGVGKLPSMQVLAITLLRTNPKTLNDSSAAWALSTLVARPSLLRYTQSALDLPIPAMAGLSQVNATLQSETALALELAVQSLTEMTLNSQAGLMAFPRNELADWELPRRADVTLNLQVCVTPCAASNAVLSNMIGSSM